MDNDAINDLYELLKSKAGVKQKTYRNVVESFAIIRAEAKQLVDELNGLISPVDKSIVVEYIDEGDFEFHVKFSGDILIFLMQTNIITLDAQHELMKGKYIEADDNRKYFGHIMVYNFLADSVKYHRLDDPGYLIARVLINHENNFFIEGTKPLNFLFPDIAANSISSPMMRLFIENAMVAAIQNDLVAPAYPDIQRIRLVQKINQNQELGRGQKIGFQMKAMSQ